MFVNGGKHDGGFVDQYSTSTLTAQGAHSIGELQEQAVAARDDFTTCEFSSLPPLLHSPLPPHVIQHITGLCSTSKVHKEQAARVRACNYIKYQVEFTASTKNSDTSCACCVDINHYVLLLSTHMCSIFSTVQ